MTRADQDHYLHADHQSSIVRVTDTAGAVVNSYEYDAYGRRLVATEGVALPYGYTGRECGAESGLMYYRARMYDPATGRFLQTGPLGFAAGGLNLYRYAFNSPIDLIDPSGEDSLVVGLEGEFFYGPGGDIAAAFFLNRSCGVTTVGKLVTAKAGVGVDASVALTGQKVGGGVDDLEGFAVGLEADFGPVTGERTKTSSGQDATGFEIGFPRFPVGVSVAVSGTFITEQAEIDLPDNIEKVLDALLDSECDESC